MRDNRVVARRIEKQGEMLKVNVVNHYTGSMPVRASRGNVTEFSAQSRMRMLELFARIDRNKLRLENNSVKFVTLTYPSNMTDAKKAKRDLKVFIQRVRRKYEDCWLVWRMEYQKRGAIHFHLMLGNVPFFDVTKEQSNWSAVTGEHSKNSLDLEVIRTADMNGFNGVMYYVAKYMSKTDDSEGENEMISSEAWKLIGFEQETNTSQYVNVHTGETITSTENGKLNALMGLSVSHIRPQQKTEPMQTSWIGRFWGVSGKKFMPFGELVEMLAIVTEGSWKWIMSKMDNEFCRVHTGFTLFGAVPEAMLKTIETVQQAWYNDDASWEFWEWCNKRRDMRHEGIERAIDRFNEEKWIKGTTRANRLLELDWQENKPDYQIIRLGEMQFNHVPQWAL